MSAIFIYHALPALRQISSVVEPRKKGDIENERIIGKIRFIRRKCSKVYG